MEAILERCGARLTDGHFLLTSGRHSDRFYLLSLVLQHPQAVRFLAACLAAKARNVLDLAGLDAVVGPAMGGVLLAHELAAELGVRSLYAEKENGGMRLRRGFRVQSEESRPGGAEETTPSPRGGRVLVAEDALTTGGSVAKTMDAVRAEAGEVLGVTVVVHRGRKDPHLGAPLLSLLEDPASDWAPKECPLCARGVPLTQPKR